MILPGPYGVPVLLFDCETNGLLDSMSMVHCLVIKDNERGICRYNDQPHPVLRHGTIEDGVRRLLDATKQGSYIAGHNVIKFDVPAIQKLFPWFHPADDKVLDTLILSRLIYADIADHDAGLIKPKKDGTPGKLPKRLYKSFSLEAWGYRLGVFKSEYEGDPHIPDEKERKARKWESWNQSMDDYCVQDVEATAALWNKLLSKCEGPLFQPTKKVEDPFSWESVILEHEVAHIIAQQERFGFCFDRTTAGKLYAEMVKEKLKIEAELVKVFRPRYFKDGPVMVPKRDNRTAGYVKDCALSKVKLVEFNPGSRMHIAIWLKALHGWEPVEYTADGSPKVDETVLEGLPYPEAKLFVQYLTITKRLGQLSEGKESWLRHEKNGRIHGSMITNGAVTGRATHSNPNVGQVPSVKKNKLGVLMGLEGGWGYECRALWGPPEGYVQVGIDMSGIELRCLAHFMGRFDGGAYGRIVVDGDVHSENQRAAQLATRDLAKTFIYAFLYGAGDAKIGSIVGRSADAGKALKARFLKGLPALGKLLDAIRKAAGRGYLKGLDGRLLTVRHKHAALNTLLQSAGAILSKKWITIFHRKLREAGLANVVHQMAWVHDEIQVACLPCDAETVGKMAVEAIVETGEYFKFRVPITGEYKIGRNWAECH